MDRCHQAIDVLVLSGSTAIHWAYVSLAQSVPPTLDFLKVLSNNSSLACWFRSRSNSLEGDKEVRIKKRSTCDKSTANCVKSVKQTAKTAT